MQTEPLNEGLTPDGHIALGSNPPPANPRGYNPAGDASIKPQQFGHVCDYEGSDD